MVVLMHIVLFHLYGWHCQLHPIYTAFLRLGVVYRCVMCCAVRCGVVFLADTLVFGMLSGPPPQNERHSEKLFKHSPFETVEFSDTHRQPDRHIQFIRASHNSVECWIRNIGFTWIPFKCYEWIFDVKCQRNRNLLSAFCESASPQWWC